MIRQARAELSTSIMLVEDNEDDRMMVEDLLQHSAENYTVSSFDDGPRALEHFAHNGADCIILDYRLGPDDGITLLSELKKHDPVVPVILLTGQGSEELASTSIKSGAADYLVKRTLNEDTLRSAIQAAIKQGSLEKQLALQAKEQSVFLKVLVHDLKAPLISIKKLGTAALEEQQIGDNDNSKRYLVMQNEVAERAYDLVSTLENYALLDGEMDFKPVCLTSIAEAATENLQSLVDEKNASVTIGELPTVSGHVPQLVQLFQNLIQNGLKYNTSDKPEITIDGVKSEDASLAIVVKDNGIGIEDTHVQSIFQPFKRLCSEKGYEGTGLGLATCNKIVQRHEGKIWCTSSSDQGSQFHLAFPARQ